jgi:glycosyltransferase involved in cell wall biosynthesis
MHAKKVKTIAIWGSPPPPIGGMSVHIQRLSQRLKNDGFAVQMYNFSHIIRQEEGIINVKSIFLWYFSILFGPSPRVHYIISTRGKVRFLASLLRLLRGKKIIIRVGGSSMKNSINGGGFDKWLNILSLKFCSALIGVNEEICKIGCQYTKPSKINHIPGFIAPIKTNGLVNVPTEITKFFGNASNKVIITGQVVSREDFDIYGLWDVFSFIEKVKFKNIPIKCCIISYGNLGNNSRAREEYCREIELRGMKDYLLFYHNDQELWQILPYANIFIRTSYTDGDANSIREALFMGKTVIASDSVKRVKECILFKTGDMDDLTEKYEKATSRGFFQIENLSQLENYLKVKNLITSLL